ncbi:MAG: hypothetical protein D6B27_08585 [Gammaproteobacteria bacterium]|nr:MAG: hypothetical protein D6B27_08585 [Gammaproteobacteria bacterium]
MKAASSIYKIAITAILTLPLLVSAAGIGVIYKDAVLNDPLLGQARKKLEIGKVQQDLAKAQIYPNVSANIAVTESDLDQDLKISNPFMNDGRSHQRAAMLSLSMPLYNFGIFSALKQAKINIHQKELEVEAAKQDLIIRVVSAYFETLAARDNLEFTLLEKKAIKRQLDQIKNRLELGQVAATGVYEAQARYDLMAASVTQAEETLANRFEALREITGKRYNSVGFLKDNCSFTATDLLTIKQWQKLSNENNPDLAAADKAIELAQENIQYCKTQAYPYLSLDSNVQRSNDSGYMAGTTTSGSLTISLSIPIYSGGKVSTSVREASKQFEMAKLIKEQGIRKVYRQINASYNGVNTSISRITALKQALASAKLAHEATASGYEFGTRTIVDVINAQTELHRAQLNLKQAKYSYILNRMLLKRAAGTITPKDINKLEGVISAEEQIN